MSRLSVDLRRRAFGISVAALICMVAALAWAGSPSLAADQSALTELNQHIATTLRTLATHPRSSVALHPLANAITSLTMPVLVTPGGRRFVLPAWAAPFTRASRLLHVRSGDLEFDGWGALRPGGVVRLQYTLRL
jgi:hypothetical protein